MDGLLAFVFGFFSWIHPNGLDSEHQSRKLLLLESFGCRLLSWIKETRSWVDSDVHFALQWKLRDCRGNNNARRQWEHCDGHSGPSGMGQTNKGDYEAQFGHDTDWPCRIHQGLQNIQYRGDHCQSRPKESKGRPKGSGKTREQEHNHGKKNLWGFTWMRERIGVCWSMNRSLALSLTSQFAPTTEWRSSGKSQFVTKLVFTSTHALVPWWFLSSENAMGGNWTP